MFQGSCLKATHQFFCSVSDYTHMTLFTFIYFEMLSLTDTTDTIDRRNMSQKVQWPIFLKAATHRNDSLLEILDRIAQHELPSARARCYIIISRLTLVTRHLSHRAVW